MTERPPLSVVVGTREGWPYVRPVLEAFRADAERLGVEVIFADGSAALVPSPEEIGPNTRWLKHSGQASVFMLYWLGLGEARGEVVATTEDHSVPRAGWLAAIIQAHAEHPDAAAIGGAIENGSRESLLDWASYFITQGPHMAPLGQRAVPMTTNEANLSFKRWTMDGFTDSGGQGFMAILELRRLADRGGTLRVDDRMVVDHQQTIGFGPTSAIHYHNGRSISGFRRARGLVPDDWLRLAAAFVLPVVRTARILRQGWAKGRLRSKLLASVPLMLWLDYCQAAGHVMGYALGPGDSPECLR